MHIIIGLGNPGGKYRDQRHNIGFAALDRLAQNLDILVDKKKRKALVGQGAFEGQEILLAKPQTFMNRSGDSVGPLARYTNTPLDKILVIYDEMDLPFGRIRIRDGGGAGGHNGMRSIISAVGGSQFPRLRIGIGRPETDGRTAIDHVLGAFSKDEQDELDAVLDQVVSATKAILMKGISDAMNSYNVG